MNIDKTYLTCGLGAIACGIVVTLTHSTILMPFGIIAITAGVLTVAVTLWDKA
jgi:hypothetical protein